jgi:type IV pilus assembly protein PilM
MQNPFRAIQEKLFPYYIGIDIGTTSIKAVEVHPGQNTQPEVLNYGILESSGYLAHANKALQTSTLKLFDQEMIDLLKALLGQMKPRTDVALASLPTFSAFTTVLDFPEMTSGELQRALTYQAKQYIPLPISEVYIDSIKVGEYQDDKGFKHQQVLLISIPQEHIAKHKEIFKSVGLTLRALELESISLTRMLIGTDPTPTIIVDIGSRSTNIIFTEKGQLRLTAQSDFGGASLTQALATGLSINPLRAEELKKEKGIVGQGAEYELSTVMLPFLDAIISEVRKAQFNYQAQFIGGVAMERVILSGGGANLKGIEKYVQTSLGLPVVKAAPFLKFGYPPAIDPLIPELNPTMSVALGLTLREFV